MELIKKYPLTLLCMAVIWYLSFFTVPPTNLDDVVGIDKLVHTAMYGGWCLLFWWEHFRSRFSVVKGDGASGDVAYRPVEWSKAMWYGLIAPAAMGGLIELLQENCTNHRRSGDWWDFGANTLGVVLMYLIAMLIQRKVILCYPKRMSRWLCLSFRQTPDQVPQA